jgi:mannosyl-glycoprotein endo-beta-N-acetylglucosaminidase
MKWNPDGMQLKGYATHQYATHIAWAVLQTTNIKNFYDMIDNYTLIFDVPKYQP